MALRLRGDLPFLKQIVAFDMPDTDSLRNSGSTFVQLVGCTHHSLLFSHFLLPTQLGEIFVLCMGEGDGGVRT